MTTARITAFVGFTTLLAGCGGGASTPAAPAKVVPVASPATVASGTPIATAKLVLKFPATFHTAKRTLAAKRLPAYVNASSGNNLDVFVDGVDAGSLPVTTGGDGTQTISLPIYSTSAHQIVAIETDASGLPNGNPLALGETDLAANSFQPGDITNIGLTMLMAVTDIGITTDPTTGNDALIGSSLGSPLYDNAGCPTFPAPGAPIFFFAADAEAGFVSVAGAGVAIPTVGNSANVGPLPPVRLTFGTGLNGGVTVVYGSATGEVAINASVANPAYTIVNNVFFQGGSAYPGIYALYQNSTLSNQLSTIYYNGGQTITRTVYAEASTGC